MQSTKLSLSPRACSRLLVVAALAVAASLLTVKAIVAQPLGGNAKERAEIKRAAPSEEQKPEVQESGKVKTSASVPSAPLVESAKAPIDPDAIMLYLMDGSVIAGKLSLKEIAVQTDFGDLSVPVRSIKSITPGLQSHPALAKQISQLIADLGSSNYNDREKAQQALLKMGLPVRAELERHQNDGDVERRNRIKAILTEFDQLSEDQEDVGDGQTASNESLRHRDTVETTEFTIVGKIVPQSFDVSSLYGSLNVKLADIRRAQRDMGRKEDVRQTFTVDASQFAMRNPLTTSIRVERGDIITITADGTLNMTPWGSGAISTPDGAPNYGWFIAGQIPNGALVGKIGNENFAKLGSKSTITASRSGVLQLAIGMQNDYAENQFPGKYTVKVRVQKKQPD